MDGAINFLNVEIGIFVRYLRCFSQIENVQINTKTIDLMQDAVNNIHQLYQKARIVNGSVRNDVDFLFDLDERQYELQRHIFCRTCYELFPLSKEDYMAHLKTSKHLSPLSSGFNSFSSVDCFPESESVISQPNGHSTIASLDLSSSQCYDQGFGDDNTSVQSNASVVQLKYSDIVRKIAPPTTASPPKAIVERISQPIKIKPLPMTLGDLIRTDQCYRAITIQMVEFLTPTAQRRQFEQTILESMSQCFKAFDPVLKVHPCGSVAYGFGGTKTNYNILIDTRKSDKSPALLLRTFNHYFLTTIYQRDFEIPNKIPSDRVLKQQLHLIHKPSRIECYLLFDNDDRVVKAGKIICDVFTFKPICRRLISYIKAWQTVVNGFAVQSGHTAFQFNTYIISVLVIFFLQMNYGLPVINDIPILVANEHRPRAPSNIKSTADDLNEFDKILAEFFHFYGGRYEINNHLISTCIGRWQEQRLTGQQKHFTPEQKRLRDAMSANPNNWQKCCMFVQDLIVPGLNITAEVSREEAFNFQEICQMFSTSPKHSPVKRVLKTHPSPQASPAIKPMCKSWSQNSLTAPNVASKNVIKSDKPKPITSNAVAKKVASKRAGAKTSVVLENAIKDGHIFDVIATEKTKFCTRSDDRNRTEQRILGILRQHFKIFDRTLALTPFGSTTFGFGGNDSNYNIFIDARKSKYGHDSHVLESFEKYLTTTNIHLHFNGMADIPATRTLKQQLRLIHKESGIHVLLLIDDVTVTQTSKIIRDYITIKPICRDLIEYIVAWKNALHTILAPYETAAFQFNTYMIAVLVIFFVQVNYDVPVIADIDTVRSNADAMKKVADTTKKDLDNFDKILAEFFWFYGQRYQIWNHVISLNIGRWQERRIQDQQKFFLPNQKRLRDGINSNPANWKNCTMYVEDLVRSGVNIAAEVTFKDAYIFQEMCQMFAKKNICQKMCRKNDEI